MTNNDRIVLNWIDALSAAHASLLLPDVYTHNHHLITTTFVHSVGYELGLSPDDCIILEVATRTHDIGKIGLITELHENRWNALSQGSPILGRIRTHAVLGERFILTIRSMMGESPILAQLATILRSHHERPDGFGYPDGLQGADIPFLAGIVGALDGLAAMTGPDRLYRRVLSLHEARQELLAGAGSQFNASVVYALDRLLGDLQDGN
jgi:HD-GYP domain-containing protein (c-di-GMP phosphodiesterase class II)